MRMQENSASFNKENVDIVCFSLSRWDAAISSPAVSLAKEFSKRHRVFFIEHPYSIKDFLKERKLPVAYTDGNVHVIRPSLVLPVNFLRKGRWYAALSGINDSILLKTLRNVIKTHGIKAFVFINFFDPFYLRTLPKDIKPQQYIYQCMDDLAEVPYTRRHALRLEEELMRNSDVVLCTSRRLTEMKSAYSPHVFFHPNGVDFELFNKAYKEEIPRPAEIPADGRKIVGLMGSIEYRTDFMLLRKAADRHRDKLFVLVGPVYGREHLDAGLDKLPNVLFTGARHISELPRYLRHFDCCLIPYKKNTLTASIYPLKINEYLAAGKPVVATAFSKDIMSFRDSAWVAQSDEEFINSIDKAIETDDVEKRHHRMAVAALNSWQRRVEEFWDIVT